MKQKPGLLQKKFMVPTSAVGLGVGNWAMDGGMPAWLVITIIVSSLGYAAIEAWMDIARMKYGLAAPAKVQTPAPAAEGDKK